MYSIPNQEIPDLIRSAIQHITNNRKHKSENKILFLQEIWQIKTRAIPLEHKEIKVIIISFDMYSMIYKIPVSVIPHKFPSVTPAIRWKYQQISKHVRVVAKLDMHEWTEVQVNCSAILFLNHNYEDDNGTVPVRKDHSTTAWRLPLVIDRLLGCISILMRVFVIYHSLCLVASVHFVADTSPPVFWRLPHRWRCTVNTESRHWSNTVRDNVYNERNCIKQHYMFNSEQNS